MGKEEEGREKREVGFDGNGIREEGWSGGFVERGRER